MATWGGPSEIAAGGNTQRPHRERDPNLTGAHLHSSQLGKPDAPHTRQGSGILTAREGEGTAGRGCRKKRRPSCNRADRATKGGDTQPERVQTSDWCLVTRKFGELPQRGKANVGGPMACLSADRALAGAPSSGTTHVATPSVYRKVVAVSICRGASHQRGVRDA